MAKYGYVRVSTIERDTSVQRDKLRAAGCSEIFEEEGGCASRKQLKKLVSLIAADDILVVCRIDRLATSVPDLASICKAIEARGGHIRATDQDIDTTREEGRALFKLVCILTDFDTMTRRERQFNITSNKTKTRHGTGSRGAAIDPEAVRQMAAKGLGAWEIARELRVGRASVYRLLAAYSTSPQKQIIRDLY